MQKEEKLNTGIDIKKIIAGFTRNWYVFALFIIGAIIITYMYNRYQVPVYGLNTSVLIETKNESSLSLSNNAGGSSGATGGSDRSTKIDKEISLMESYIQYVDVLENLGFEVSYFAKGDLIEREIYLSAPFRVNYDTSHAQIMNTPFTLKFTSASTFTLETEDKLFNGEKSYVFNERIEGQYYDFVIESREGFLPSEYINERFVFIINSFSHLVNKYRWNTTFSIDHSSGIIEIGTNGTNTYKESVFLDNFVKVAIRKNLERKYQAVNNKLDFIDFQINKTGDELTEIENNLENFRKRNDLMQIQDRIVPILGRVSKLTDRKKDQLLDLKYYQYLKDYLISHDNFDDIVAPATVGVTLPLFTAILEKLAYAYLEKENLIASTNGNNPYLKNLDLTIRNQKQMLMENINNIVDITEMKIADFDRQLEDNLDEYGKLPELEREFLNIQRVYQIQNELYNYMLQKRSEAEIEKASIVPDIILIDKAGVNGIWKISPNTKSNYMRAIILAVLFPGILIFILVMINKKITNVDDLKILSNIPIYGKIPHHNIRTPFDTFLNPDTTFAQSLRLIRTHMPLDGKKFNQTIAITSSIVGEGKTFSAMFLAYIFALTGKKTLLADFDFQRPEIGENAGIEEEHPGVSDFILWDPSVEDIITYSGIDNLDILPIGNRPQNIDQILQSPKMAQLFEELKQRYQYIILDTAPVGLVADTYLIREFFDISIVVVRKNLTPINVLNNVIQVSTNESKLNNLALIINDVKVKTTRMTYDYYVKLEKLKGLKRLLFRLKTKFRRI